MTAFHDQKIVKQALRILEERARYEDQVKLGSPTESRDFFRLRVGPLEREEFWAAWLDSQNQLIQFEQLFVGTLNQTSVYPREVVKSALSHNAAAVIFSHNHPSGLVEPSRADEALTTALKTALALVDVKVLDHIIVGPSGQSLSFAERGLV